MLQLDKLSFTDDQILNNGVFVLVEVTPSMNDTTGERIGTDLVVALTGHHYEKMTVKVTEVVTCSAFETPGIHPVQFTGFIGRLYLNDATKEWELTATADRFQLVR